MPPRWRAKPVAGGADLILVLGGDGTINEAVNGWSHSNVPLGILPAGTANVLAMELGLGSQLERAVERLAGSSNGASRSASCATRNGAPRHFLAMGGRGLDAKIVYDLNPGSRPGREAGLLARRIRPRHRARRPVRGARSTATSIAADSRWPAACAITAATWRSPAARRCSSDDFEIVLFEGSNPLRYLWYMLGVGMRRVQAMRGRAHAARRGKSN